MKRAFIFIDNLRIGGFQRLALDQAYGLSDMGFEVTIISLTNIDENGIRSFVTLERDILKEKSIRLLEATGNHFEQFIKIRSTLESSSVHKGLVISHSLRATVLLSIAKKSLKNNQSVLTSIHQLPTLSAPIQRFKRFIYSQFTNVLTGYSVAVLNDWENRMRNFPIVFRVILKRRPILLRNGVYLKRLPAVTTDSRLGNSKPRLVFLGRTIAWKGLDSFLDLAKSGELLKYDVLLMVPDISSIDSVGLREIFGNRLQIISGKTISEYSPRKGDVHIYPTAYGETANYLESISLNCLEMACLGVPSLVTEGGLFTWPETIFKEIFFPVRWNSSQSCIDSVLRASSIELKQEDIDSIRSLISIDRQLSNLIALFRF